MRTHLCLLLGLVVGGCTMPGAVEEAERTSNADAVITMKGHRFAPDDLTITLGQTIEWVNTDAFLYHTVTLDPDLAKYPRDVQMPPGAQPFNSGKMPPGAHFRQRFDVPGQYQYVCLPHETMGMIGRINVQAARR